MRIIIELHWNRRVLFSLGAVLLIVAAALGATVTLARSVLNVAPPSPALTAPTVVSYQGRVAVNGQPFNGTGQFKFAVVNAEGAQAYWSNDGTGLSTAPFTPTKAVALPVVNGLFNVLLGDTSLTNMTQPMKPDVFGAPDRMLRVWFNDGTNDWQQLSPDVRVASAPYALNAEYARTSPNLQRIALLKWYTAITGTGSTFSVDLNPQEIAFDGRNMWVTNITGNTVSVLRTSDGYHVMTPTVGSSPYGIAFDGANMWVANSGFAGTGNTVSVLRASDGYHVMTPTVGSSPDGIAFDGANMWVTNHSSNTVSVLRASDGYHVMTPTTGSGPIGIAFDGANMWVTNFSSNTVSVLRASDGYHVMTPTVGTNPQGIAYDGANMWVANRESNTVSVLRASDGYHLITPTVGSWPVGIAFDGANMWVTNAASDTISVLRASDGYQVMTLTAGPEPWGIAFDGAFMWVTNYINSTVSKR